jgi:hypothetical protein
VLILQKAPQPGAFLFFQAGLREGPHQWVIVCYIFYSNSQRVVITGKASGHRAALAFYAV